MGNFILLSASIPNAQNIAGGYITGIIIALLLLIYLVYSLIHPEKF